MAAKNKTLPNGNTPEDSLGLSDEDNVDLSSPHSEQGETTRDNFSVEEKEWIKRVVNGEGLVEALGSRSNSQFKTIRSYLNKKHLAERLVAELALAGQLDRVNEVLGYKASLAALQSLEKGDRNVILALLPKAQGKAAKASKEAPVARVLEAGAGDDTAKKKDSGQS